VRVHSATDLCVAEKSSARVDWNTWVVVVRRAYKHRYEERRIHRKLHLDRLQRETGGKSDAQQQEY
jgi:hypothetical protein